MYCSTSQAYHHPKTYPNYPDPAPEDSKNVISYSLGHGDTVQYGFGCKNGTTPKSISIYCSSGCMTHSNSETGKDNDRNVYFARFVMENQSSGSDHHLEIRNLDCSSSSTTDTDIIFNYDSCNTGHPDGCGSNDKK